MLETAQWCMEPVGYVVVICAAVLIIYFLKDQQADVFPVQHRTLDGHHLRAATALQ